MLHRICQYGKFIGVRMRLVSNAETLTHTLAQCFAKPYSRLAAYKNPRRHPLALRDFHPTCILQLPAFVQSLYPESVQKNCACLVYETCSYMSAQNRSPLHRVGPLRADMSGRYRQFLRVEGYAKILFSREGKV